MYQNTQQHSVRISGAGIPAAEHGRIFERLHRIDPNIGKGCGLGLAIVAQHGACISVSPGDKHPTIDTQGSQFTVKFSPYEALPAHSSTPSTHPY